MIFWGFFPLQFIDRRKGLTCSVVSRLCWLHPYGLTKFNIVLCSLYFCKLGMWYLGVFRFRFSVWTHIHHRLWCIYPSTSCQEVHGKTWNPLIFVYTDKIEVGFFFFSKATYLPIIFVMVGFITHSWEAYVSVCWCLCNFGDYSSQLACMRKKVQRYLSPDLIPWSWA